ncbi:MAG: hypothetical protein IT385_22100 [Deltaproteobacteria bacterium]|nr:hypothetical protein [Deltaproteobacteria bacterium]
MTDGRSVGAVCSALCVAVSLVACGGDDAAGGQDGDATTGVGETAEEVATDAEIADETSTMDDDAATATETSATETSDDTDTSVEVDVPIDPPSSGFPASGLLVRIADPGANGSAEVTGASARVAGLLFGDAQTMLWQSGAQSGEIVPGAFWQSGQIVLTPGDNVITVTAVDGATSVSDSLVVTYNPGFRFDDRLQARPAIWWVGEPTEAVFTVQASLYKNFDPATMQLVRVDAQGELVAPLGPMKDDGLISASGDEIEKDGVFTWSGSFTCESAGPQFFRASVRVNASPTYEAVSATLRVECLARMSRSACEGHDALITSAGAALEGGADMPSVLAQLRADLSVRAAGPAEDGSPAIWVEFTDGLLGAVIAPVAGTRGGGLPRAVAAQLGRGLAQASTRAIGSLQALVLSPFHDDFEGVDESAEVASLLEAASCPPYEVLGGKELVGGAASIGRLRGLSRYGIVSLVTHGAPLFGGADGRRIASQHRWGHIGPQEILWTGSAVDCGAILTEERPCVVTTEHPQGNCPEGTTCLVTRGAVSDTGATGEGVCFDDTQADLLLGRALLTNRGLAVTPSFFTAWRGGGLPSSWVHLGACHSMWNGSLASALYAAGALAITGFSGTVDSGWAKARALEMFTRVGEAGTIDDLHTPAIDPSHPETRWRLFSPGGLVLAEDFVNADFEIGSTQGWTSDGDGRVVAQFGDAQPVGGKFMGLVSSGLGYSVETGRLTQDFCIPEGRTTLTLWWRFYSEEFKEWCGDEDFQDSFRATLEDAAGGTLPLVTVAVDDLCQYEDGTCAACPAPVACDAACFAQDGCFLTSDEAACTGSFACQCGRYFEGLAESDIGFDRGGVWRTQWRKTVVDVSALAGRGPVTLALEVQDSGDSSFDTAILIDEIKVE